MALLGELRAAGVHVLNVGDSVRPRNLYHAVKEGSAFGHDVDARSGPARGHLPGSAPPGHQDEVLVELEPDTVVAVDPR